METLGKKLKNFRRLNQKYPKKKYRKLRKTQSFKGRPLKNLSIFFKQINKA